MMVEAIKQGAHMSTHTMSQFLLYFIFSTTLLFSNVYSFDSIFHHVLG